MSRDPNRLKNLRKELGNLNWLIRRGEATTEDYERRRIVTLTLKKITHQTILPADLIPVTATATATATAEVGMLAAEAAR